MKQLTCEMCGSTDLIKQDGVFVCQTCGTKYSIEEAKKMMVEVAGAVEVKNAAQLENLLNLAKSSFESKNYAQAEAFCNQVIAMDDKNYEAWKLKGEAINYQINAKNQRILEVYNCIMTSYRVLSDEDKDIKKYEVISSLKTCFEGEVDFWLKQFEAGRPTDAALNRVKNAYVDAYNKMKAAFEELGLDKAKEGYLTNFDNFFIKKANLICVSAWKSTVAYNYYRDDFDTLGRNWGTGSVWNSLVTKNTDSYRPTKETLKTFIEEGGKLIALLQYAEEQFNDKTPYQIKENIYSNIVFFHEKISDAGWYHIGTSGYDVGWLYGGSLTGEAKAYRKKEIDLYKSKIDVNQTEAKLKAEVDKLGRIQKYWANHQEEKSALDSEQQTLQSQKQQLTNEISELQKQKDSVPALAQLIQIQKNIEKLEKEKDSLGLFKGKEKKLVQEKIDVLEMEKNRLKQQADSQKREVEEKIAPIREKLNSTIDRLNKIKEELTKDR